MNDKKAKKLRKRIGFKPHEERKYYTFDDKHIVSLGKRRAYQKAKQYA